MRRLTRLAAALMLAVSLSACSLMEELQPADPFDIELGACFDVAALTASGEAAVPTVDCAEPHEAEITWKGPSSVTGDYDQTAIAEAAAQECRNAIVRYVGPNWIDLDLKPGYLYPDKAAWGNDKRIILCYAQTETNRPTLTTSVKNRGQ